MTNKAKSSKSAQHAPQVDRRSTSKQSKKRQSQGLQRLVQAIAKVPAARVQRSLSHAECDATLEFYVDAELRGEEARTLFPKIWHHLETCPACHLSYSLLSGALKDGGALDVALPPGPHPALDLPFLKAPRAEPLWVPFVTPGGHGAPLRFGFAVGALTITSLFATGGLAPAASRDVTETTAEGLGPAGDSHAVSPSVLVSDMLTVGKREVSVDVRATRTAQPAQLQVTVALGADEPFPAPVRVALAWRDHRYLSDLAENRALFPEIPASDLALARDLRIEFETALE